MSSETNDSTDLKTKLPRNAYLIVNNEMLSHDILQKFSSRQGSGEFWLYHSFDDLYYITQEQNTLIVLGHCFNPFDKTIANDTVRRLADAWCVDDVKFLDYLEQLSGRFVVIVTKANGDFQVVSDACATLPVCYYTNSNRLYLASHAALIQALLDLADNAVTSELAKTRFYNMGIRHCPPGLTEVEGVSMLSPNQRLSYTPKTGAIKLERIFPRVARKELPLDEVVEQLADALRQSMQCLVDYDKPLSCALSGGVDSRVSLAATKVVRDSVQFFTFAGKGNAERDLACTQALATELDLVFTPIILPEAHNNDFVSTYKFLQGATRAPNAKETFQRLTHFENKDAFEIRSSVSEVARSFMKRKFHIDQIPMTPGLMVPLYKRVPFSKSWHKRLELLFKDWMEKTAFKEISEAGYEWLDFYYWEFRVGSWQSLVLQDADYYTNPTVIFSNRTLLKLMLAVPERYRENDELQKRIMLALDSCSLNVPLVKNFGRKAAMREALESSYFTLYRKVMCR
nr:asparagine synthase-related protein [Halomonas sp. UBA3074]